MTWPPTFTLEAPLMDGTVLVRLPTEDDSATVYTYGQDPDIEETTWLPVPFPCSPDTAARTVEEFRKGWGGRHGLTLAITIAPDSTLLGVVHLSAHANGVCQIGYGIAPRYRRRGLATRAVRLVAAWSSARLGLTRLEIVVTAPGDHGLASRRVAEAAGFVYEGMRHSHVPATGEDYEDPLYLLRAPRTIGREDPA